MNFKSYLTVIIVVTLLLTLVVVYPLIENPELFPNSSEQFSEFWLLGPDHVAENFPFNVTSDKIYTIFVEVANHMNSRESYIVSVKFRNRNQSLLEFNNSRPSSSSPLSEFKFSVDDETVWKSNVNFVFHDTFIEEDVLTVGNIVINGIEIPVDVSTQWDPDNNGFYFQLFFELWRYDLTLERYNFANQFVGILLNMTSS